MIEEFEQGMEAAKEGKAAANCPYPTGGKRLAWLDGYFSVKVRTSQAPATNPPKN